MMLMPVVIMLLMPVLLMLNIKSKKYKKGNTDKPGAFPRIFYHRYGPAAYFFTLRGQKFFKKGQLQGHLKQLSLDQDPDHNTR